MSLFVNPAQFGPGEDLARYPRDEDADLAVASAEGADVVFAPGAEIVYPEGFAAKSTRDRWAASSRAALARGTFAASPPSSRASSASCGPQRAFFGEKDYQQLVIVRNVARDLALGVEVVGVPTVRDADGLALSSRNRFLSPAERERATTLYAGSRAAGRLYAAGEHDARSLLDTARARLAHRARLPRAAPARRPRRRTTPTVRPSCSSPHASARRALIDNLALEDA